MKTHNGVKYRRLALGEIVQEGDRWMGVLQNNAAGRIDMPTYPGHYYYRPIEPIVHNGLMYRQLKVGEIVQEGDLSELGDHFTKCTASIGSRVRDMLGNYWRISEKYTDAGGYHWRRLKAGEAVRSGDKTGVLHPTEQAPEGTKVRKSRHVWRIGHVYRSAAKLAVKTQGSSTFLKQDTYTAPDGRPWRRLEEGAKIRPCDRYGVNKPGPSRAADRCVHSLRHVWRPAGPPVRLHKGGSVDGYTCEN